MNPLRKFRKSKSGNAHPNAHMTWARGSVSQKLSRTRYFLKRQLWIWPIIAVLVLGVMGYLLRTSIEDTIKRNLESGLQIVLDLETEMLRKWFDTQQSNARNIAREKPVRDAFAALLVESETGSSVPTLDGQPLNDQADSNAQRHLLQTLMPRVSSQKYAGFFATDRSGRIICSSYASLLGQKEVPEYEAFLPQVLDGESTVSVPFPSVVMMKAESGRLQTGQPTMYVAVPIRDDSFHVIGALALQVRPDEEFTHILQFGRVGDSGETYAFDRNGVLVSNSRFDTDLILLGLLPDEDDSRSILNVHVRDPGGDMTTGFRPTQRRNARPLTAMAADAVAGNSGVNVTGYRDYRGVPVVGAWTWMPNYQIGVTTEVDVAQAFRPIVILQRAFWSLFILLALSSLAIFIFTLIVARLRREAQTAAIEAQQLGQYKLEQKLGEGAMGVVYKGHHAMLRRATAIKLLDVDKVNDTSIARFEREVQVTCQLNHPNTIAIYDYGRTPEGVFYYAMEYLDGIDLQDLVERHGPQSEARVIHLLTQICGSLSEAHTQGLVHRDIKPANVVLSRRGGEPDVVKVLDFGLVRALDQDKQSGMTADGVLTGTPLYMSPEAIQSPTSVDARSDLYAVGAVGYYLLTGHPVFSADSLVELCQLHVDQEPLPPSERLGRAVSSELEHVLLACLSKSRSSRPQTAREVIQMLNRCEAAGQWSFEEAELWWSRQSRLKPSATTIAGQTKPVSHDQTVIASMKTDEDEEPLDQTMQHRPK